MDNPSISADASLPDDIALCRAMIRELLAAPDQARTRNAQLEHRLDLLLKRVFGPRADRVHPDQPGLFDGDGNPLPEPPAEEPAPEPPAGSGPAKPKKPGHGRRPLPENLRRETVEVDVPEADKIAFGGTWTRIGEEASERLDYTPSSLFVRRTVRPKYVVRFGGCSDRMQVADLPPEAFTKSKAAPGLVADVIVSKLVDHLPLYRQEQRYARQGVEIARATLCGWMAEAAIALTPLYLLMKADLLKAAVLHVDDTTVPVQDETLDRCRTGRLWTYLSERVVLYEATPNRNGAWPAAFLKGFEGYLQCDAYSGYDGIFAGGKAVEVACGAHVRRKFVEAQKTAPAAACEAVARIGQLYAVEAEARELDAPARAELRWRKSQPILDALGAWLQQIKPSVLPKSPLGDAVGYAANQWKALNVYVEDGGLSIDNNAAERAIKPYAIGRKNWLFFGSDAGGKVLTTLSSFTATCLRNALEPWAYLRDAFTRLPHTPPERLAELLPYGRAKTE